MKRLNLSVSERTETGTGPNRRLRVAGKVPAVVYGGVNEATKVTLDYREFDKLMSSSDAEKSLINLSGSGLSGTSIVIIREIQRDPVTRRFLHVDLYNINMNEENEFEVPIHSHGVSIGVREGGLLETHRRSIFVRCLPAAIPDAIDIDLTELKLNHSIHVSDIGLPENVTMVTEPTETVFTVVSLRAEAVATPSAEPAAPEVVGKKKEDDKK